MPAISSSERPRSASEKGVIAGSSGSALGVVSERSAGGRVTDGWSPGLSNENGAISIFNPRSSSEISATGGAGGRAGVSIASRLARKSSPPEDSADDAGRAGGRALSAGVATAVPLAVLI